nr:MAG TPA: hypothetical protein [Caudoviricetes sp.]
MKEYGSLFKVKDLTTPKVRRIYVRPHLKGTV